jgi:hypothetical protein
LLAPLGDLSRALGSVEIPKEKLMIEISKEIKEIENQIEEALW